MIAFIFTLPIFQHFDYWGIQDWDQHLFYHAVPRSTILEYHQFPLWNPYYCGGTVLLANPQSRFLSPSFLLILLFGAVKGIKIEIWQDYLHLLSCPDCNNRNTDLVYKHKLNVEKKYFRFISPIYDLIYKLDPKARKSWSRLFCIRPHNGVNFE